MTKHTCELCSMEGTHTKTDSSGVMHHYCAHHAPKDATGPAGEVSKTRIKLSTYVPIISIYVVALFLTYVLLGLKGSIGMYHLAMVYFMGFTFLSFGLFKVLDIRAFADGYQDYDIIGMKFRTYALMYPFIELILAGLYLTNTGGIYRDLFTLILMVIGSIGVFKKLQAKEEIPCVCLGVVFKLPMTKVTLFENGLMILMVLAMLPMYFMG